LKITFLGTGTSQGIPLIGCRCEVCSSENKKDKRLRSSVHIEIDGLSLVIDSGPDFRYQMLRAGVVNLDAILFTHGHKDHTAGFDDIRAYNFMQQRDMEVYCNDDVNAVLHKDFDYVFAAKKYPGVPKANIHIINNDSFEIQGVRITPILVYHHKMPVFGFRIGDFTYITDANRIDAQEIEKIAGSKVLVLNALRRVQHISHFTLDEAIDMSDKIGADKTYFTHISHQLGLHSLVSNEIPDNIELAYDGLTIEI